MRTERAGAALLGLLLLGGCPGTLDDKDRFLGDGGVGSCGDVPTRIFQVSCAGTGCHGSLGPQQGLHLESPGVAARVLGVRATGCMGILADPQGADTSLLYAKLQEGTACGSRMPLARPPLSAADVACVRAWILSLGPAAAADGGR